MSVKEPEAKLLEDLAELEHQQWSSFVDYLIAFAPLHGEYNAKVFWEHYDALARTSYSKLTEEQKDEDRKFARKTLPLIMAFADARVKEATDKLKRAVELLIALPPDYYVSNGQVWVQGLGTTREWEDWLMKVNKFLEEAKPTP